MGIGGFLIAFIMGWKFALVTLGTFPFIAATATLMVKIMQAGFFDNMAAYAKSGAYAEQAINGIRIVSAFGQEKREEENYKAHLDIAR